jgi:beta-alanine--pyruvate transaminase
MAPVLERLVHALRDRPHVVDVRNVGLVAAVELSPRDGVNGVRAQDVFLECFRRGVLVRQTGDTIAVAPPLIISEEELAVLIGTLSAVLDTIA